MLKDLKKDRVGFTGPDGCNWETRAEYMYCDVLPSCGCGDPSSIAKYVKEMLLKHVAQPGDEEKKCWDITKYKDLPVMFFLSWADHEGYIEHGTTIRCSWMSEKGIQLLKDLDEVEREEHESGQ
jgi:hypothetical protein